MAFLIQDGAAEGGEVALCMALPQKDGQVRHCTRKPRVPAQGPCAKGTSGVLHHRLGGVLDSQAGTQGERLRISRRLGIDGSRALPEYRSGAGDRCVHRAEVREAMRIRRAARADSRAREAMPSAPPNQHAAMPAPPCQKPGRRT